jgi:uncharacterized lipoprotein YbaY
MAQYEKWTRTISTQRVTKVEIPFAPIVRIAVRSQQEAELYLSRGVALYQEEMTLPNGATRTRYYVEVSVYDIAEVARKD